jgi:hypothetical protein
VRVSVAFAFAFKKWAIGVSETPTVFKEMIRAA